MKNLTLIIPTKNEVESLPIFLGELKDFECSKLIVLQKEDLKTILLMKSTITRKEFHRIFESIDIKPDENEQYVLKDFMDYFSHNNISRKFSLLF